VTPDKTVWKVKIFGPALSVVRAKNYGEPVDLVGRHEYARASPSSPATAPRRAPSPTTSRSAWSGSTCRFRCRWPYIGSAAEGPSLFGDHHMHAPEGVRFYTRLKTITTR
jgi:malonate-semialdehyde dehydrogenase (acetylating)/methylmalonate-semialdehyde dehydrogenase